MVKLARHALPALLLLTAAAPVLAQSQVTVDRLWGSPDFFPQQSRPTEWLEDGSGYTTLEPSATARGLDLVRYAPETGVRDVLIAASDLRRPDSRNLLVIESYSWSPDGSKLLIMTNTRRVWRDNTRGDFWLYDREKKELHKLGGDFEPTWLQFAKFSPQGDRVAYVYKNNIYVENIESGGITQLTDDGSKTIINGTFDWVYEEEFHIQDGFRWSPDGKRIAYWQLDAEGVGEFYMVDNLSDIYAKIVPVQYPKAGTTNSSCRVGVVPAAGGETAWMKVEGDPRNNYIARMEWAGSSDRIVMQYLNRQQNANRILYGDPATGEITTRFVDREKAWLDAVDDQKWFDNGNKFTWLSERDGWRHLYVFDRDAGDPVLISPGDYDIIEVAHIDTEGGWVYITASRDNPTQKFLSRVPLAGGPPERLTPPGSAGYHEYDISPDAKWAIHTWSTFDSPPRVEVVSLPKHEVARTLLDNEKLRATVAELSKGSQEFFRVKTVDGVELDGWCIKPPDFDPEKKWPVVFHVYGEPWSQTVLDRWGMLNYIWHLMLAQRGYVVMSLDNRGTPAPRGREWRKCVYGAIGVLSSRDQAQGLDAIAERWSWVDTSRIGIWGWSGGGSMTLNMLFRYPTKYHVGISVAPVPDQRLYDTIYQERYSGLPSENERGYQQGSPITFAHRLRGELLLVHGTADDNVHFQGAERLVDVLVAHDKQFTFMAYPGRSHGIFERRNTRRHLYKLMTRFLLEKLPPGPKS